MNSAQTSIFIRTYVGDIEWLRYCLKSIHMNLSGWNEIVVCIPRGQEQKLQGILTNERFVTCEPFEDDYIGQQVSKLQAHHHITNDLILLVDSDTVFKPGASVTDYQTDGLPTIYMENYAELSFPAARCWQPIVEKLFGDRPEWEYMRRGGAMLYNRSTLEAFESAFPDIESYAKRQPYRAFSEYNYLGFFAARNHSKLYHFIDLNRNNPPKLPHYCFWSWGGFTLEVQTELEELGLKKRSYYWTNLFYRAAKATGLIRILRKIHPSIRHA